MKTIEVPMSDVNIGQLMIGYAFIWLPSGVMGRDSLGSYCSAKVATGQTHSAVSQALFTGQHRNKGRCISQGPKMSKGS